MYAQIHDKPRMMVTEQSLYIRWSYDPQNILTKRVANWIFKNEVLFLGNSCNKFPNLRTQITNKHQTQWRNFSAKYSNR